MVCCVGRKRGASMWGEDASSKEIVQMDLEVALREVIALSGSQASVPLPPVEEPHNPADDAPIVLLANTILQSAIKERASDIHIEPTRSNIVVRFRIDGVMHEVMQMPGYITQPLTRRYKYLADISLYDPRAPQQGSIGTRYDSKEYDLRVNVLPTAGGQRMVIHICNRAFPRLAMNKLGFTSEMQAKIEDIMQRQRGMLIIAGGSGQGRTATEYVLLDKLAKSGLSIYAVSDYYDYYLKSISQATLNHDIGYTAEAALRSIADLDADVIALDRCEDRGAIRLALELASGRALALHTVNAANVHIALRQLLSVSDVKETYSLVEGLNSILAQTLVRRICAQCREEYHVPAGELARFGYKVTDPNEMVQLARGKGCEVCRNTGYKGRTGLFELVTMNDAIAATLTDKSPQAQVEQVIRQTHPLTMREDGLSKILQGITTPEEVARAVPVRM